MFELESQVVGPCQLLRARGAEAINALPRWQIEILCEAALGDLDGAAGAPATLRWWDDLESATRHADLTIIEVASEGEERRGHRYSLLLAPPEHRLTLRSGYRIFLDQAVPAIAAQVLIDAGIPADRLVLRLASAYLPRKQCTQYGEREWTFVERLLAEEGISYWFDTIDGRQVMILGDSSGAHDGIAAPVTVPYDDASGLVRIRSLSGLELTEELCTTAVTLRDFDVRNPDVYVDASAGAGPLSHFEYPSFVPSPVAAKTRAEARLEQLQRFKVHARAASDVVRMQPGRLLRLQGCADERMNQEYLVVGVDHTYDRPSPHDTHGRPYTNQLLLVPGGKTAFRPAIPTVTPRIEGIESAMTTGAPGEEIHVDDLGRVKLRFLWDPSGITDDRSSAWARCLQWGLGGSMLLPRVGWEVPVAYLDGNPDHPFVLGRLYNATAVVPYALPGAAATTALKSATSPGGGSTNELRMSDDAGRQEMAIHASKDQSVSVGGSSTTQVSADQTHDVGLMLANVVLGSQSHSVAAVQAIDIGTSFSTAVKGAATMTVGAAELLNATANRTVAASGAYVEVVGSSYALQCNQSNYQVTGRLVQLNGAASVLTAGLGVSESVAGARVEVVGGSYSVVSAGGFSDTVYGAKRIQAGGAAAESAGGPVATSARLGKVKATTATLSAGGDFAISGANITIEAASISAGALEISGGALRGTSGTTKVDASVVKHKSGGKIG